MHRASALYGSAPRSDDDSALILRHAGLLDRIARRLASKTGGAVNADDLWSAGALGLLEAARRFDATRAVKFETFAEHRIRGAMLDELRKLDHLPRRLRDDTNQLEAKRKALADQLGRKPTLEELCNATGLSAEALVELENLAQPPAPLLPDLNLRSEEDGPEAQLEQAQARGQLTRAIEKLPKRLGILLGLHYVEGLTYKEIAAILTVSEPRVCQLHAEAMKKLRELVREE